MCLGGFPGEDWLCIHDLFFEAFHKASDSTGGFKICGEAEVTIIGVQGGSSSFDGVEAAVGVGA